MKHIMWVLSSISLTVPCVAQTSNEVCAQFLEIEKQQNKKLPIQIDQGTEFVQVRVNCDTKTIHYTKRILVDPALLAGAWRERKQRQHTQLHCNARGLASTFGWTALDTVVAPDYSLLATLKTGPADCQ